jgi:hypothetical protein
MATKQPTSQSGSFVAKAITLLKDPKVQQAIMTAAPIVIGLLKSKKKPAAPKKK